MNFQPFALHCLRIFVAIIFITHGIQRSVIYQTVGHFGEFLSSKGFPLGFYLAWLITLYELIGGTALAFNRGAYYLSIGFIIHQIMGIALVHAKNGWFVVGPATGGMEYSALLIMSLVVIFSSSAAKRR